MDTPLPSTEPTNPVGPTVVQIPTPAKSPSSKSKNWLVILLIFFVVILSLGTTMFFAYQNVQLKQQVAQITPTLSPTPTANLSEAEPKDWKSYTNPTWKYSFKYPPQWGVSSGGGDVVSLMSNAQDLAAMEKYQNSSDQGPFTYPSDDYGQITFSVYKKGANTAAGMVTDQTDIRSFVQKMFNQTYSSITDITLGGNPAVAFVSDEMIEKPGLPPHMQSCPPEQAPCLIPSGREIKQVWTKINGNLFYAVYSQGGSYKDVAALPTLFDQILSTFKFIENITPSPTQQSVPSKTLNYSVPSGWKTVQDSTGSFTVSYNPTTSKVDTNNTGGIFFLRQRPDPSLGNFGCETVNLYTYDGGSRHQFIYKYLGETPTKESLFIDYKETEYLYNGKSCLVLNGISISQFNSVWGMCDTGNGKAFLFTSCDRDNTNYEKVMQTIQVLK
jgi:hypothetical protein